MNYRGQSKGLAIILAAGNSTRMGRPKQLIRLADGRTLLQNTIIETGGRGFWDSAVILGEKSKTIDESLMDFNELIVIRNNNWQKGIGSSIKKGISLAIDKGYPFVIILVADQPFLRNSIIDNLYKKYKGGTWKVVVSKYSNFQFGVPVLFDKIFYPELMNLKDESGALSLIRNELDSNIGYISFEEGAIDIDTPEDMEEIL